jgi:effector-binding domain-containing protein
MRDRRRQRNVGRRGRALHPARPIPEAGVMSASVGFVLSYRPCGASNPLIEETSMVRRRLAPLAAALALVFALPLAAVAAPDTQPPAGEQAPTPNPQNSDQKGSDQKAGEPTPGATALPGEAFGEAMTLTEKTVLSLSGNGLWDSAFETILDAFKTLYGYLDRQGIKPVGPPMAIYTSTDDAGFQYRVAVPIEAPPANPPQGDLTVGKSPAGKAYRFVHRGSYDSMDATYEAITNFLDEKAIEAQDLFIEEYVTDPLKTAEDKLVIDVYVPVK